MITFNFLGRSNVENGIEESRCRSTYCFSVVIELSLMVLTVLLNFWYQLNIGAYLMTNLYRMTLKLVYFYYFNFNSPDNFVSTTV